MTFVVCIPLRKQYWSWAKVPGDTSWRLYNIGWVHLISFNPGACFSRVPRTFRDRKTSCQTLISLVWKLIFKHNFNVKKTKTIAKFGGLEPWRCEDIKEIVVPEIDRKGFGTFEKQTPGHSWGTRLKLKILRPSDYQLRCPSTRRLMIVVLFTAHSPDNLFLGFVVSAPVPVDAQPLRKKPVGLVYGKDVEFWQVRLNHQCLIQAV